MQRKRSGRTRELRMCLILGVATGLALLGGCPSGLSPEPLAVSAGGRGEPTVGKTIELVADITGGTAPFTVQWQQVSGPTVTITDANAQTASFVPPTEGFYTFAVDVTDSSAVHRTGTAQATIAAGDIRFEVAEWSSFLVTAGNPAVLRTDEREDAVMVDTTVTVFDPEFTSQNGLVLSDGVVNPHNTTQMSVAYSLIAVPAEARTQDVTFARATESLWDNTAQPENTVTIQANPEASFLALTNIATTVENFGVMVPGEYVFRASVTNADGVTRTRDLPVTLLVEDLTNTGLWGNSAEGGMAFSAGPEAVVVKELPAGSPGPVTDKVMRPADTATMTVTVFPSSDTSYRFFLEDNNGVAHPEFVTASAETVVADGAPHDITLTIGAAAGLPTATYTLAFNAFDNFGSFNFGNDVTVNDSATEVRFHVTDDFLAESSINAALVGRTSNDPDAPTHFEGWAGDPDAGYGRVSALADVNLDGALDILTMEADFHYLVRINVDGFRDGSAEALRHPENDGNFGPQLPEPTFQIDTDISAPPNPDLLYSFAVGDLNGDGLPDFALGFQTGVGAPGQVDVYFHTGDPAQPYSEHADQTLRIRPPATDRQALNTATGVLSPALLGAADTTAFGFQVGIFDQTGDDQPDLIVTDPKFAKVELVNVPLPGAGIAPPAANVFYLGNEGRVYVFAGGANGVLRPGRPEIITSLITEREVNDGTPPIFPTNPALSATFSEAAVQYARAYVGAPLDLIGDALSNGGAGFAVGSSEATALGSKMAGVQIVNPVADGEFISVTVDQPASLGPPGPAVTRTYEFDNNAVVLPGDVAVDITGDNSAAHALAQLIAAINGDAADEVLVTAAQDGARPERANLVYAYGPIDGNPRTFAIAETMAGADNTIFGFTQNHDGRVYRVASNQASGALTNPINGIRDSSMGLGEVLALGAFNAAGTADDLAITALDPGTAAGVNDGHPIQAGHDDGAVFVILDGATPAVLPVPIADVGATTLRSGGLGGTDLAPTAVGSKLAFGDINGDNLEELFFDEPGFDHIYMILGAATPANSPDITFTGVTFDDDTPSLPVGASLGDTGTFLIGDITGDTQVDWLFLDVDINFGFAGFARD